ncbi:uncharacterized protein PAC_15033 [Phialocephala subalpina]|uniref:NmrA-like domain-containing protein n=1 Tax=Phialocephala subalpina TaxID=576137 RepID=A0A1L7XJD3_9HELO|nr:uncharacterized protein PAC_15033 [Phialocephala subalpina]
MSGHCVAGGRDSRVRSYNGINFSHRYHVEVAGASGRLGIHVVNTFQSPTFKPSFGEVVALVRDTTPQDIIETWKSQGVTVRSYTEENMAESLQGVDTLINILSSKSHHFKNAIAKALPSSGVTLYFLSEFGVDHSEVKRIAPNIKVSRVYVGLFTEDSIGPWFGFNTKEKRFECVGSPDVKISFTTREDSGKVMTALAALSPKLVPEETHILDMTEFKDKLMKKPAATSGPYLGFIMKEDKLNHSKVGLRCDDELVNPGEREDEPTTRQVDREAGRDKFPNLVETVS